MKNTEQLIAKTYFCNLYDLSNDARNTFIFILLIFRFSLTAIFHRSQSEYTSNERNEKKLPELFIVYRQYIY